MASNLSYTITIENNKSEKEAINYLLEIDSRFILPDKQSRKEILEMLNIDKKYARAFDLIFINTESYSKEEQMQINNPDDLILVELKTTRKKLPNLPSGFFFGATQSEFEVAAQLGENYKFCFVSLHEETKGYHMLTLNELNTKIKTKRIQYQINI